MKQLVLALVFLNLVYFFWGMTTSTVEHVRPQQTPLYAQQSVETLRLLSKDEVSKREEIQPMIEPEPEPEPVSLLENACYLVGLYENEKGAAQLATFFNQYDSEATVVHLKSVDDFWLIYPSNGDWDASLKNTKELKIKGVKELWLIPNGENKGVISLGLFATKERADKRLKELERLTVNAIIRTRSKQQFAVKLILYKSEEDIRQLLNASEHAQQTSVRKISC